MPFGPPVCGNYQSSLACRFYLLSIHQQQSTYQPADLWRHMGLQVGFCKKKKPSAIAGGHQQVTFWISTLLQTVVGGRKLRERLRAGYILAEDGCCRKLDKGVCPRLFPFTQLDEHLFLPQSCPPFSFPDLSHRPLSPTVYSFIWLHISCLFPPYLTTISLSISF